MPKQIGETTLYDLKELSKMIDLTVQSLRQYISNGKIKAKKIGTKWYVTDEALQEYLSKPDNVK